MRPETYIPAVAFILLCCAALYFLLPAHLDYRETRQTVRRLELDLGRQEGEVQRLREELAALRVDYREVERVAREKFGLCREGEKIYHFDRVPTSPDAAPPVPGAGVAE